MNNNNGMTDAELDKIWDREIGSLNHTPEQPQTKEEQVEELSLEEENSSKFYCFPSENDAFIKQLSILDTCSDETLVHGVLKKSASRGKSASDKEHYYKIREKYCALHILLNQRNLIAPAFRPLRKLTKNIGLSISDTTLAKDRAIIDLHYLHTHHRETIFPKESNYADLLIADKFDYELAAKFAGEKWKANFKSDILGVTENIQVELLTIRNDAVRQRLKSLSESTPKFETMIRERASKPRSRIVKHDMPLRITEYKCLKLAGGEPSEAARLWSKMTGEKLDDKQTLNLLKRLSERKKWIHEQMGITF